MNNRLIGFAICALLSGGVMGWLLSDINVSEVSDNDVWHSFEASLETQKTISETADIIKSSGIIRKFSTRTELQAGDAEGVEQDGAPPLPKIIGTSVVNGTPQVHLKMLEGPPIALIQGESLENGWLLKTINLKGAIFQYEDTERSVLLREYDLTPEQTPDDNGSVGKENVE
jgi:hypothetical protein